MPAQTPTAAAAKMQNPQAFTENGVPVFRVRKNDDDPRSELQKFWYSFFADNSQPIDVRTLPGYSEPEYDPSGDVMERSIRWNRALATEAERVIRLALQNGLFALAPTEGLPWEFARHMRSALQPTLALGLLESLRMAGITSPYIWVGALRLGTLALSLAVTLRVIASASPALSVRSRRLLWLVGLFIWFGPLFYSRYTSENLGGIALAAAITVAYPTARARSDRWLALLLGLSFVFRFQMGFAVIPVLAWLALRGEREQRLARLTRVARISGGIAIVVAASTLVDRWFYGVWVVTPWEYFRVNILEGVATTYGSSPWWDYFIVAPLWTAPPLGIALIGLLLYGVATDRTSRWSWAIAGYLIAHFAVGHKELRFLFPLIYFVPVLVAGGWDALERRVTVTGSWRVAGWLLAAQNVVLALLLLTPSVHRGKEFDWQYMRFLWTSAEAAHGRPVYVLVDDGNAYRALDWTVNVYRHPAVRELRFADGDSLPRAVPPSATPNELLIVTRSDAPPHVAGAAGFDLVYEDEPGYRAMARWVGAGQSAFIRYLEGVDYWTNSEWKRRVYRVRMAARP